MKRRAQLIMLGLGGLLLAACSPTGAKYWLLYEHDSTIAPQSVYKGYYTDHGKKWDQKEVQGCITPQLKQPCVDPNEKDKKPSMTLEKTAEKPPITDRDYATVMYYAKAEKDPFGNLTCSHTLTPIKRPAQAVYPNASLAAESVPNFHLHHCEFPLADAGGNRLDYLITEGEAKPVNARVADSFEVHTTYRFRVMLGPVYSSLSNDNRKYSIASRAGGDSIITSSVDGNPASAAVFLKYFWYPRDVYDTRNWWDGWKEPWYRLYKNEDQMLSLLKRINPIVGVSVSENPFKNVYVGLSAELFSGIDIVGGAHWSAVDVLTGGFSPGQVVPTGTMLPTETRFLTGWFAGVTVDLGVAGTWLGKSVTGFMK
ncbi:MAG: hypothetical protein WBK08_10775 [Nitrospira sp.]